MLNFKQGIEMLSESERDNFHKEFLRTRKVSAEISEFSEGYYASFKEFIACAFVWVETTQGYDYWYQISVSKDN